MNTKGHTWKRFAFPENPLVWNPTCWHINRNIEKLLDLFLSLPADQGDMVFFMWGAWIRTGFRRDEKETFP